MAFVTDPNLLADIKKGDNAAWNLFAKKYGALIWLRGSDYHLTPDEQEQLTQDVLVSFFKAQDNFEYAPEKGRFRDYLRQIIKNCIFQILRKRQQDSNNEEIQENTAFDENDDEAKQKREDEEWMAHVYSQALAELK
ncbi:MAG: sigma-70 family RNA polymerase sigma factor, partial [Victivallales bacterium]|nr:sigma-70 family RNA polymerase sigma factor [Victivallales bacterium]